MKRGDVVIEPFPFQDKSGEKIRPAVVVQSDSESQRLANTILAMITGNLDDARQAMTVLVDPRTSWAGPSIRPGCLAGPTPSRNSPTTPLIKAAYRTSAHVPWRLMRFWAAWSRIPTRCNPTISSSLAA